MIKQVRFHVCCCNIWLKHNKKLNMGDSKWGMCTGPVYEIFDIPGDAKFVWLTAHKRPSVNRVKVKLDRWGDIEIDGERFKFFYNTENSIVNLLKKHGTFYVSAEYQL